MQRGMRASATRRLGLSSALAIAALLLVTTGAPCPALAGPPPGWQPGVEGQQSVGPVVWSADGTSLAVTGSDHATLGALGLHDGTFRLLSTARGAGHHPASIGGGWLFKEVVDDERGRREQQVVWACPRTGARTVLERGPALGDPSVSSGGLAAWSRGATLNVRRMMPTGDFALVSRWRLPAYANLVALAPSGDRAAWQGPGGELLVLDLGNGRMRRLDADPGSHHPEWSSDGQLVLTRGPGSRFTVIDARSGHRIAAADGSHPTWFPGRRAVLFDRVETLPYEVLEADLWRLDVDDGAVVRLTDSPWHERFPVGSPDGRSVAFVETTSGALLLAPLAPDGTLETPTVLLEASALPCPAPRSASASSRATEIYVPYMHQLWDTPDNFDGGWSCGPTSCVQTLQKYLLLPDHDITVSSPSPHKSPWGWYVPNEYSFKGYTYDTLGLAKGDVWVPGAHGFICRSIGAAGWAWMVDFLNQHDVESWQAGTSFASLTGEIDAGYPMVASTNVLGFGHIIVMKGYDTNRAIVVNDPYGDANGTWGQFNGDGAVYDWPGYNNGNRSIEVKQLFGARGTLVEPEPQWDASFVAADYPPTMVAGQLAHAWVDYQNEGQQGWSTAQTRLGTTEPRDRDSTFHDPQSWLSESRPAAPDAATAPGAIGRFRFGLRAPAVTQAASYTECWGLVQEGEAWFGPADDAVCFEILVLPAGEAALPVADAGPDQTVALGSSVTLDGSGSTDPDGTLVSWIWQTPAGTLAGERVTFTPTEIGTLHVTLTVTDEMGLTGTDSAIITVTSGSADGGVTGRNDAGCDCRQAGFSGPRGALWLGLLALALARRRRRGSTRPSSRAGG